MTQADSTLVRITRKLKRELEELGQLWACRWMKGDMSVPAPDDKGHVSMERIIQALLQRDRDHRERSRKNSVSKRPPGANGGAGGTGLTLSPPELS